MKNQPERKDINRSDIIHLLAVKHKMHPETAQKAVKAIVDSMIHSLSAHNRIELRGFGSFETRFREAGKARNPRSGDIVEKPGRHAVHFKPGKMLKKRVDNSAKK